MIDADSPGCGASRRPAGSRRCTRLSGALFMLLALLLPALAAAHGVEGSDARFIEGVTGVAFAPFMYLGAKHMITGWDHLLYLAGVIFFLYRLRDVALFVTLFAVGHSITLLFGVLAGLNVNEYLVDAVIGLSVVYKGFENVGGFRRLGVSIDPRAAVFAFGLVHGFGLATALQGVSLSRDGLIMNMIGFNVGVELGQIAALVLMLVAFNLWRRTGTFERGAFAANCAIMAAGFVLFGVQMTGFLTG